MNARNDGSNGNISVPQVQRVSLDRLNRAEYNPRKISTRAKAGLERSMSRLGVMNIIVWNEETGNVVGGHQRLDVIEESGAAEADVVVVHLPHDEEVALNIALNNPFMTGSYTRNAVEQLEGIVSVAGDDFETLRLDDLMDEMRKIAERADRADKKKEQEEPEPGITIEGGADMEPIDVPQVESVACIRCPRCQKEWRMDKKV